MDASARFEPAVTRHARRAVVCAVAATLLTLAALAAIGAGQARAAMTVTVDVPVEGVTFTDSGGIPTIEYSITGSYVKALCHFDDDLPVDCFTMQFAAPFKLAGGAHTASVLAIDAAGDSAGATANFSVSDATAPSLTIGSPGAGATVTDALEFDLTLDDTAAELFARVDGGPDEQLLVVSDTVIWSPLLIANGAHSVSFTAIDPAGNQSAQTLNFTLNDTTAPVLTNLTPSPGSTVSGDQVRVSFNSDDQNVHSGFSIDGHAAFDLGPGTSVDVPEVTTGAHTLAVTAADSAGNFTSEVSNFNVSDTSGGPLTVLSPADGATYTARPLLQVYDPALVDIDYSRCRIGGGVWVDCANGEPVAGLANGAVQLDVRAVTTAGDLLTGSTSFTLADTTAPALTVLYPASGETVTQLTGFAPTLDVTNQHAGGTDDPGVRVRCKLDAGTYENCGALIPEGQNLAAGAHTLKAEAIDWAGNRSVQAVAFTAADTTAPAVRIVSPANGATLDTGRPAVTLWTDDENARFSCAIDSSPSTEICLPQYPWLPGEQNDTMLAPGAHTLSVTATDQAGNTATNGVSVTVADFTAPVVTIISPPAGTLDNRVTVLWRTNERIARVRCRIDGGPQISDQTQCAVTDLLAGRGGVFAAAALANGPRTLAIDAYDAAGNLGTASVAVTVADVTPPSVRIVGFSYADGLSFADAPTGAYFTSDDTAATFQCRLDGGAYAACDHDGSLGEWHFPPPADGSHTLDVLATDAAGLSGLASATFEIADTTPPTVGVRLLGEELGDGSLVPISFTAQVVTDGATSVTCALDAGAPVDCSGGSLPASFASGGTHSLRVTATDAAANQTVRTLSLAVDPDTVPAPPGPGPGPGPAPPAAAPVAPPVAPPSPSATFAAIKANVTRRGVTVVVKILISLPDGVNAAAACAGRAPMTLAVSGKRVGKSTALLRLAAGRCSAAATLKVKSKPVAGKRASFTVAFAGNAAIGGFTVSKTVKIKKRR